MACHLLHVASLIAICALSVTGTTPVTIPKSSSRKSVSFAYHEYDDMVATVSQIAATYPNLVQVSSIGTSVQGRDLVLVQVGVNVTQSEAKPKILHVNNMHGDERVGREVALHLIDYLCSSFGTDAEITFLLSTTRIFFVPSLNPDGGVAGSRENAAGVDLNRDYPDVNYDPQDTTTGRQPETVAMMQLLAEHNFVQSLNTHGGELVCNYPLDSAPVGTPSYQYMASADDSLFIELCSLYAQTHLTMSTSSPFSGGITNGYEWYQVSGGLQDYAYLYHGSPHVTLELSTIKTPDASTLSTEWDNNRAASLAFFARAHSGVRGVVVDTCGNALLANVTFTPLTARVDNAVRQKGTKKELSQRELTTREEIRRLRDAMSRNKAGKFVGSEFIRFPPGPQAWPSQHKSISGRIVGGQPATVGEYPFASRLTITTSTGTSLCGGTLIHADWILTAAHCLEGATSVSARIGGVLTSQSSQFELRTSTEMHIHPQYNSVTYNNDIALFKLSASATRQPARAIFSLSTAEIAAIMTSGRNSTVIGWGTTSESGSTSSTLLEAVVPLVSDSACTTAYGSGYISSTMVCAGYVQGGTDSCQGDSGGPLLNSDEPDIIFGIVSWGDGCARPGKYGVYTRLSNFASFVESYVPLSPSASPSSSVSATRTPSSSPTISVTPSITPTISHTSSITPTISHTSSITPTISHTSSITPTISLTRSPTISPSPSTSKLSSDLDCNGATYTASWLGDGHCDVTLACEHLNYDGGDCILDCNGNPCPAQWNQDSICDNGGYSYNGVNIYLNCDALGCDGGACTCISTPSITPSPSISATPSPTVHPAQPVSTDTEFGGYYRMLLPGSYSVLFESEGCTSQTRTVVVPQFTPLTTAVQLNVELDCPCTQPLYPTCSQSPAIPAKIFALAGVSQLAQSLCGKN